MLNDMQKAWVEETLERVAKKMEKVSVRSAHKIPYTTINGVHDDKSNDRENGWWTNGFWGGLMWLMHIGTGNDVYKVSAEKNEEFLDEAFKSFFGLHHDVGFMWHLTAGVN